MKCPNCNETLLMSERMGVEVDYCPSCRGVWLDKGELDKLLAIAAEQTPGREQKNYNEGYQSKDAYKQQDDYKHQHPYKKKKSFLSDFLDFD